MANKELPTVYVKWAYTDERGNVTADHDEWFATQKEAEAWIKEMKRGNGGYFQVIRYLTHADFLEYVRMKQLETELERLRKIF